MMEGAYAYKLSDETDFTVRAGEVSSQWAGQGFLMVPFLHDEGQTVFIRGDRDIKLSEFPKPYISEDQEIGISVNKDQHISNVTKAISLLNPSEKVVISRVRTEEGSIDIPSTLKALAEAYPNSMVYAVSAPECGTWIGATPEILLSRQGWCLYTMALAGTRAATETGPWDEKNMEEHLLVYYDIIGHLKEYGLPIPDEHRPYSQPYGAIQHLRTDISTCLPSIYPIERLKDLVYDLAPTPALCGYPRSKALKIIRNIENFNRSFYGGICGPIQESGDFSLYALLRSVEIIENGWRMIAGGGITTKSNPEEEWDETEKKVQSIAKYLRFIDNHPSYL